MKPPFYIFLPLLATVFNGCIVLFLLNSSDRFAVQAQHHQPADRQIVVAEGGEADALQQHIHSVSVDSYGSFESYEEILNDGNRNLSTSFLQSKTVVDIDKKKDPNLKEMKEYSFEAYVRPDVSTYYQEPPGTRNEVKPMFNGQAGKFVNISPDPVTLWWVDSSTGQPHLNGEINPWGSGGTATFPGHTFIFTKYQQSDKVLCTFHVTTGINVYYCDPFASDIDKKRKNTYKYSIRGDVATDNKQFLESLSDKDRHAYEKHIFNLHFGDEYQNFTNGSPWLTMYPPNKLLHPIWPTEYFGQTHIIATKENHFHTIPKPLLSSSKKGNNRKLSVEEMKNPSNALSEYREQGVLNMTLKVLSCTPKAFEIRNFLSDVEVDHILSIVNQTHLERSTTNGHVSNTRTSRTTWISRDTDPILNSIFRRVADVVQIDEAMFRQRKSGEVPNVQQLHRINEDLQIVHYDKEQQYTAHHDFGYPKGIEAKDKISRSINLAMYLNDVVEGGHTSFPRYRNGETFKSIDVKPEKGKALLFYMVNPDGNLEDMSQHAALPVIKGEKYFANLWMSTFQ